MTKETIYKLFSAANFLDITGLFEITENSIGNLGEYMLDSLEDSEEEFDVNKHCTPLKVHKEKPEKTNP